MRGLTDSKQRDHSSQREPKMLDPLNRTVDDGYAPVPEMDVCMRRSFKRCNSSSVGTYFFFFSFLGL
jgi:hypothetical protein